MSFETIKRAAVALGLYRQARWVRRTFFHRDELRRRKADRECWSKLVGKGDLVFDVGANYGEKAQLFLDLGAQVVAIEPLQECATELRARCGKAPGLTLVESALGPEPGEGTFYVRPSRSASGFVRDWGYQDVESEISVPIDTLDNLIARFGVPDFLKIDVEGFELEVLKGLSQPVRQVSFEFHLIDAQGKLDAKEHEKVLACIEHLSAFGELQFNLTPAEHVTFAFDPWLSKDDFLSQYLELSEGRQTLRDLFPDVARPRAYGDIFIRMVDRN